MGTTRKQAAPFYVFPPKLHAEFSCLINAVPTFYGYLRHLILLLLHKEIKTKKDLDDSNNNFEYAENELIDYYTYQINFF